MSRYRSFVLFIIFFLLFGAPPSLSQTVSHSYYLLIPPFKAHTAFPFLVKGLQQVLIDELNRITERPVVKRELVNQFLKEQVPGDKSVPIFHAHVPNLTEHFNAENVLLIMFNEKHGNVAIDIRYVENTTGNTIKKEMIAGLLRDFPKLEKDTINATLRVLGLLDGVQSQERSTERSPCLLEGVAFLGNGLDYRDNDDFENAADYFRRAISADLNLKSAQHQLKSLYKQAEEKLADAANIGMVYLKGGNSEKAAYYFADALSAKKSTTKALIGMGKIYLEKNELEKGARSLQKAITLNKNNAESFLQLARLYNAQKKYPEAISLIEQAIKIDSKNLSINLVAAELYETLQEFDKAIQHYIQVARTFKKDLDIENCLHYLRKIKRLSPRNATPYFIEGDLRFSLGNYQEASKLYEIGKKIAPDNDEVYQKLAFAYQKIKKSENAKKAFEKALELNPANVAAHIGMGDLNSEEQRYDQAIDHYLKAKELAPQNKQAVMKVGKTYSAKNENDKALTELSEFLEQQGKAAGDSLTMLEAHKLMANICRKNGDLKKAKRHLEKAIEIDPDDVSAYGALGMVEVNLGDDKKAQEVLAIAKLLDPDFNITSKKVSFNQKLTAEHNHDILQFVKSFPSNPPEKIACLMINRDINKPNILSQIRSRIGFFYEDWQSLSNQLANSLSTRYRLVPSILIDTVTKQPPYNNIIIDDIDNDSFMSRLCDVLQTESIFIFRFEKNKRSEDKNISVHSILFDKSQKRWNNSLAFPYPEKSLQKVNWPFIILLSCILLAVLVYWLMYLHQGFGNLKVYIEKDQKQSAFFSFKLSKNSNVDLTQIKRSLNKGIKERRYSKKAKFGRKTEKFMIEKNCRFNNIHAGHYFLYLYGVMLDTAENQIGNYQITKEVNINKGKISKLIYDIRPKTAYVGIQIMDGKQPALGAEVSIKKTLGSKYVKNERGVFFDLEPGNYSLLIHHKSKAFSKKITIPSVDSYEFAINLGDNIQ